MIRRGSDRPQRLEIVAVSEDERALAFSAQQNGLPIEIDSIHNTLARLLAAKKAGAKVSVGMNWLMAGGMNLRPNSWLRTHQELQRSFQDGAFFRGFVRDAISEDEAAILNTLGYRWGTAWSVHRNAQRRLPHLQQVVQGSTALREAFVQATGWVAHPNETVDQFFKPRVQFLVDPALRIAASPSSGSTQ